MVHQIKTVLLHFSPERLPIRVQLDRFKAAIDISGNSPDVILAREYTQWFSDLSGNFGAVSAFTAALRTDVLLSPMADHKSRGQYWQSATRRLLAEGVEVESLPIPPRSYVSSIGLWFDQDGWIRGFAKNRRVSIHQIPGHGGLGVSICYELACLDQNDFTRAANPTLLLSPARYGASDSPLDAITRAYLTTNGITVIRCDGNTPTPGVNIGVIHGKTEKLIASGSDWRMIELA